jgi:hypothetical protein
LGSTKLGCIAEQQSLVCQDSVSLLGKCLILGSCPDNFVNTGVACVATDPVGVQATYCMPGWEWNGILCARGGVTSPICPFGYDGPASVGDVAIGLCTAQSEDANHCDEGFSWSLVGCTMDVPSGWIAISALIMDRLISNGFLRESRDSPICTSSLEHSKQGNLCVQSCPLGFQPCGGVGCAKTSADCLQLFSNDMTSLVAYSFGFFVGLPQGTCDHLLTCDI